MMRALSLTQPWAGLVAAGVKLVENRPRRMIKREHFDKPFAIHATREIDERVYGRIADIAPDVLRFEQRNGRTIPVIPCRRDWYRFSRITSAVIAVATLDAMIAGPSRGAAGFLPDDQLRWYFGPIGYVLRDVIALPEPVPCKGALGFWTLPADVEVKVREQIRAAAEGEHGR